MPQFHHLCGAGEGAFVAFQAVGMQITRRFATRIVGSELHGAHAGTHQLFLVVFEGVDNRVQFAGKLGKVILLERAGL